MKYPLILFLFILSVLLSQIPIDYKFSTDITLNRYENITEDGLSSNAIVDIRPFDSTYFFLGTASGLSYVHIHDIYPDSVSFGSFNRDFLLLQNSGSLPEGGAPAFAVKENIIAISGIDDTTAATGEEIMGTGISYSIDEGEIWQYLQQPRENPESDKYHTISWGGQTISALSVTTEINNISYDLSIGGDYIYAASWAGGLRRYGPIYTEQKSWQIIPLPMDTDTSLMCELINLDTYEINPKDPWNGKEEYDNTTGTYGNHNHKGFGVYVIDDTIWAGTANGINKGIIQSDCIDWTHHFTANGTKTPKPVDGSDPEYVSVGTWKNISGNWVIGFTHQEFGNVTRLWAITWAGDGSNEIHALSYTDDGGETWNITSPSGESEKVYNLYANENRIWVATASGLYVSEDGEHWEKYSRPIDALTGEEILSESVLAVYNQDNWLWVGTIDGISIIENDTITTIHRFWEPANPFSAYPNPFLINDYNQVGGDGHVRFVYFNPDNYKGTIDIFDFAMDKVIQLGTSHLVNNNESEVIWNGRNEYGAQVANGVYFCRLSLNGKIIDWTKLAVVN